nr:unnamed protein product [Spirometra erinaceieuropaei]
MGRPLYDGMMARVTDNGAVSEAFAVTNGVKQGGVLAPTLFSLMFSAMVMDHYRNERQGIRIVYRTGGHLLNQRRMHFHPLVYTAAVHEHLSADDCALNTTSEGDMQRSMDLFSAGLIINTEKTVVMHQRHRTQSFPTMRRRSATLFRSTKIDDEVPRRNSKSSQAVSRLQHTVWNHYGLHLTTKLEMYKAVILPTVTKVAETWTVYKKQARELKQFRLSYPRRILKLSTLITISFITLSTSTMPSSTHTSPPSASTISSSTNATISETDTDTADSSCHHCPRKFTSHLGLVGHLRIHRTVTDKPVPEAPKYTRRIRLNCLHCTCTFTHCMGLSDHMRIHEYLR